MPSIETSHRPHSNLPPFPTFRNPSIQHPSSTISIRTIARLPCTALRDPSRSVTVTPLSIGRLVLSAAAVSYLEPFFSDDESNPVSHQPSFFLFLFTSKLTVSLSPPAVQFSAASSYHSPRAYISNLVRSSVLLQPFLTGPLTAAHHTQLNNPVAAASCCAVSAGLPANHGA